MLIRGLSIEMTDKKALLVIDVQVAMFAINNEVLYKGESVLNNIVRLVQKARSSHTPIIFVQHTVENDKEYQRGRMSWQIHPRIKPLEGEEVIEKSTWDSFFHTRLETVLKGLGITELVIAGMQTEFCVDTTCRRAFSMGYRNILVSDAHTTFDSEELSAEQIIRHHNRVLGGRFAGLKRTDEIFF